MDIGNGRWGDSFCLATRSVHSEWWFSGRLARRQNLQQRMEEAGLKYNLGRCNE